MTQQTDRQASVRAMTGTQWTYEGDFHALFDKYGTIPAGDFDGRMLQWVNRFLGQSYVSVPQALQGLADACGAANFSSLGTIDPYAGATAAFDFVAQFYKLGGVISGDPTTLSGSTYSRASAKTAQDSAGRVFSFASGVPAITDLGWLDEGASTNLALQSQAFNNAAWSQVFVTPVDNQALAPDNTLTAAKVTEDTTAASQHRIEQPVTFSAVPYTFSVYAKPNGRTWIQLRVNLSGAFFDIQNGVLGTVDSSVTASITKAANGFYRCTVTFTPSAGASAIRTNLATANAVSTYTGDGVSGAFLWGAQLEQASALSSYIPTTSASVTRAADALSLTYAGSPATATVTYGSGSTATPSAASPLNLGSSSGGAWVGNYVQRVVVR